MGINVNNKEFCENYIKDKISPSKHYQWRWVLDSEIANDEAILPYNVETIQQAILLSNKRNRAMTMASISFKYDQLKKLYNYADTCGQLKYNPFKRENFINLQQIVDIYFTDRINTNYVTPNKLDELVIDLSLGRAASQTRAHAILFIAALYDGISVDALKKIKFSDFDLKNNTILLPTQKTKPISKRLADALKYYQWVMNIDDAFEDFVLIPNKKCQDFEEYQDQQKRIDTIVRPVISRIGNHQNLQKLSRTDILQSGFIQYLKSRMDMESIVELYRVETKPYIQRSFIALSFNQVAIEYYYQYYQFYKNYDTPYNFSYRKAIIGQTTGYLYKDDDYLEYRTNKVMD